MTNIRRVVGTRRPPGHVKRRLAAALQRDFPVCGALPVVWRPEDLYEATGAWRTGRHDVYRWSGWCRFAGSDNTAFTLDSYETMTRCADARRLVRFDNEVSSAEPGKRTRKIVAKAVYEHTKIQSNRLQVRDASNKDQGDEDA